MTNDFELKPGSEEWRLVADLRNRLCSGDARNRFRTEMSKRRSYTISETALLFAVPQWFIHREIARQRLHATCLGGRVFLKPESIQEWLLHHI